MRNLLLWQPEVLRDVCRHLRDGPLLLSADIVRVPHAAPVQDDVECLRHILDIEVAPGGLTWGCIYFSAESPDIEHHNTFKFQRSLPSVDRWLSIWYCEDEEIADEVFQNFAE